MWVTPVKLLGGEADGSFLTSSRTKVGGQRSYSEITAVESWLLLRKQQKEMKSNKTLALAEQGRREAAGTFSRSL